MGREPPQDAGWLNAGVPLKTAQAWSGHKTLTVLLDTYLGVMHGDTQVGLARWEQALAPTRPRIRSHTDRKSDGNEGQTAATSGNQ